MVRGGNLSVMLIVILIVGLIVVVLVIAMTGLVNPFELETTVETHV